MKIVDSKSIVKYVAELATGYDRIGSNFHKTHPDFVKIIQPKFVPSRAEAKSFTLWYGFFVPKATVGVGPILLPVKKIEATDCGIAVNLDVLLSNFTGRQKVKYLQLKQLEFDHRKIFNVWIIISQLLRIEERTGAKSALFRKPK